MDDLEQRLRDLGRQPVEPRLAAEHLSAMQERPRWRFGWRAVAAAGVVGFLAGGTGLAAAGTLPDPAQDVAHDVLGAVGLNVPRSTDGCPDGRSYRNHGEYVAEVEAAGGDVEAAAKSDCGKPAHRGASNGTANGNGNGNRRPTGQLQADADGDPCTGPPPWAGARLPTAEKERLQGERHAACPDDAETDAGERQVAPAEEPTTTTTTTTD